MNYDTDDLVHKNTSYSPSTLLTWVANSHVTVTSQAYSHYVACRWQNMDTYTYVPPGSTAADATGSALGFYC